MTRRAKWRLLGGVVMLFRMARAPSKDSRWSSRRALVFAALTLLVVDKFVPFGRFVLYPFTLLATWVHEMGHGVAALLVGGQFHSLDIYADGSGLAMTSNAPGWREGVVAVAGLLAPPIAGAAILGLARGPRRARIVLGVLTATLAVSLLIWVRTVLGWIVLPSVAALIVTAVIVFGENRRLFLAQLLGVVLALDTITRIDYLFTGSAIVGGEARTSDIANVAASFGGARLLWGLLVAAVSLGFVALGLWAAWRKGGVPAKKRPALGGAGKRLAA
jgi:hypothetical protein